MNDKELTIKIVHNIYRRAAKLNLHTKNSVYNTERINSELIEIKNIIGKYLSNNNS